MCGKNALQTLRTLCPTGSPPRVREKLRGQATNKNVAGITPACAGKTSSVKLSLNIIRDHPRVCGKNSIFFCAIKYDSGSPPRVREKRYLRSEKCPWCGITPACAGKTALESSSIGGGGDHPRVCGKNLAN